MINLSSSYQHDLSVYNCGSSSNYNTLVHFWNLKWWGTRGWNCGDYMIIVGISILLLLCGYWGLASGYQAYKQSPFTHWAILVSQTSICRYNIFIFPKFWTQIFKVLTCFESLLKSCYPFSNATYNFFSIIKLVLKNSLKISIVEIDTR